MSARKRVAIRCAPAVVPPNARKPPPAASLVAEPPLTFAVVGISMLTVLLEPDVMSEAIIRRILPVPVAAVELTPPTSLLVRVLKTPLTDSTTFQLGVPPLAAPIATATPPESD